VTELRLAAGVHTITLRYPRGDLTPGSGGNETLLSAIVLQPVERPRTAMLTVDSAHASVLCGRWLDWIELVANRR
jgi:hypothetical protein